MKIFSERIKELRTERGLSIMTVARALVVGNATVCRWENNLADIKAEQLVKVAKFFEVSADYLLGLED